MIYITKTCSREHHEQANMFGSDAFSKMKNLEVVILSRCFCYVSISERAMIFEQPFPNNFYDNLIFLSFYWSKTIEREKGRESKNIM